MMRSEHDADTLTVAMGLTAPTIATLSIYYIKCNFNKYRKHQNRQDIHFNIDKIYILTSNCYKILLQSCCQVRNNNQGN